MKLRTEVLGFLTDGIIEWIREKMSEIGAGTAVIGISGGKDSTVTASLCAKALGAENVHGLIMPNSIQGDLQDAIDIAESNGIAYKVIDIGEIDRLFKDKVSMSGVSVSKQTSLNLPPRIRMTMLYAYAQSIPGALVINTSNLSEDWVGYATIYGDTAGAFSPLATLTSDEVVQIGRHLGIEERFLTKVPADGLTGKTDEDVLGFSYEILNRYIREGVIEDAAIKARIDRLHLISRFKFLPIPMYKSGLPIAIEDIAHVYD